MVEGDKAWWVAFGEELLDASYLVAGKKHGDGLRFILSDDGSVVGTVLLACRLVSKHYLVCAGNNGRFGV